MLMYSVDGYFRASMAYRVLMFMCSVDGYLGHLGYIGC